MPRFLDLSREKLSRCQMSEREAVGRMSRLVWPQRWSARLTGSGSVKDGVRGLGGEDAR
jgi:hypothetical protein